MLVTPKTLTSANFPLTNPSNIQVRRRNGSCTTGLAYLEIEAQIGDPITDVLRVLSRSYPRRTGKWPYNPGLHNAQFPAVLCTSSSIVGLSGFFDSLVTG